MTAPPVLQPNHSTSRSGLSSEIQSAARKANVSGSFLETLARVESGVSPGERSATSSAAGLYQFIEATWLDLLQRHGPKHGLVSADTLTPFQDSSGRIRYAFSSAAERTALLNLRHDVRASSLMAAEFTRENADKMRAELGRTPQAVELYFYHFLGAADARRFLELQRSTPEVSAAGYFARVAEANRPVFFRSGGAPRSVGEIYDLFAAKFTGPDVQDPPQPMVVRPDPAPASNGTIEDVSRRLAFEQAVRTLLSLQFAWSDDRPSW